MHGKVEHCIPRFGR